MDWLNEFNQLVGAWIPHLQSELSQWGNAHRTDFADFIMGAVLLGIVALGLIGLLVDGASIQADQDHERERDRERERERERERMRRDQTADDEERWRREREHQ
jgi:Tfp pilus assembly protein PilN